MSSKTSKNPVIPHINAVFEGINLCIDNIGGKLRQNPPYVVVLLSRIASNLMRARYNALVLGTTFKYYVKPTCILLKKLYFITLKRAFPTAEYIKNTALTLAYPEYFTRKKMPSRLKKAKALY